MTQIYKQLNQQSAMRIVAEVSKKAFLQFPTELEECTMDGYVWCNALQIVKKKERTQEYEVGFFHKEKVTEKYKTTEYDAIKIVMDEKPDILYITAHPTGYDTRSYDNVALWIAGQLEGIFSKIIVNLDDPTKLGQAIGWRCAYCNHVNTGKACDHCGAPKAW